MNKHIAKLREQPVKDMDRLTAELADVANAIQAIDGLAISGKPRRAPSDETRAKMRAAQRARVAADPDWFRDRMAAAREAKRLSGAADHAGASA